MSQTVVKKNLQKKARKPKETESKKSGGKRYVFISLGVFVGLVVVVVFFIKYMNYYSARNYLKEANEFLEQGDEYWAMQYAKNALIRDSEYAEAYLFRAGLLMEWNNYEECASQIKLALKYSDEPTLDMHFVYGKCLFKTGRYDEAFTHLLKVYEVNPKRDSVSLFLGDIYKSVNLDYAAAIKLHKEFFDDHRNSIEAALEVADSYYKLDNYTESKKFYNIVLRINDENPDALYGLAKCLFKEKETYNEGCEKAMLASKFGNDKAEVLLQTYCGKTGNEGISGGVWD